MRFPLRLPLSVPFHGVISGITVMATAITRMVATTTGVRISVVTNMVVAGMITMGRAILVGMHLISVIEKKIKLAKKSLVERFDQGLFYVKQI